MMFHLLEEDATIVVVANQSTNSSTLAPPSSCSPTAFCSKAKPDASEQGERHLSAGERRSNLVDVDDVVTPATSDVTTEADPLVVPPGSASDPLDVVP
jgi:hypothetical protein